MEGDGWREEGIRVVGKVFIQAREGRGEREGRGGEGRGRGQRGRAEGRGQREREVRGESGMESEEWGRA